MSEIQVTGTMSIDGQTVTINLSQEAPAPVPPELELPPITPAPVLLCTGHDCVNHSAAVPYLDAVKTSKAWLLSDGSQPDLDEFGWLRSLPDRVSAQMIWALTADDTYKGWRGEYVIRWEGSGRGAIVGMEVIEDEPEAANAARVVSTAPNEIRVEVVRQGSLIIRILETDPDDYVRNITMVRSDMIDRFDAGEIFRPEYIDRMGGADVYRPMQAATVVNKRPNQTDIVSWSDRSTPQHRSYNAHPAGMAIEDQIAFCNQTKSALWINWPWTADASYIRGMAEMVARDLAPGLAAYFELENEPWASHYATGRRMADHAVEVLGWAPGKSPAHTMAGLYAKLSVEAGGIIKKVFAAAGRRAPVIVAGGQFVAPASWTRILGAGVWRDNEPDKFIDPTLVIDAIAVAPYYGGALAKSQTQFEEVQFARENLGDDGAMGWLENELLTNGEWNHAFPKIRRHMQATVERAASFGVQVLTYEGFAHIPTQFAIDAEFPADYMEFLRAFTLSEHNARLMVHYHNLVAEFLPGVPVAYYRGISKTAAGAYHDFGIWRNLVDETLPSTAFRRILDARG